MSKLIKVQVEMPEDKLNGIMEKAKEGGVITRRELFNNALSLLEWAISERKQGRIIASIDKDEKKVREIVMPILSGFSLEKKEEAYAA